MQSGHIDLKITSVMPFKTILQVECATAFIILPLGALHPTHFWEGSTIKYSLR